MIFFFRSFQSLWLVFFLFCCSNSKKIVLWFFVCCCQEYLRHFLAYTILAHWEESWKQDNLEKKVVEKKWEKSKEDGDLAWNISGFWDDFFKLDLSKKVCIGRICDTNDNFMIMQKSVGLDGEMFHFLLLMLLLSFLAERKISSWLLIFFLPPGLSASNLNLIFRANF